MAWRTSLDHDSDADEIDAPAAEITEKVEEYLAAGVPLVWVIDPENELVYVRRRDGSVTKLRKTDELSGEDILSGFTCKVAELFPQLP